MTPTELILDRLRLAPAPGLPGIQLYQAHPGSGLSRALDGDAPPYWAYGWAGGTVLARYIFDYPETVEGQVVLDYGCGGGVVAVAAALSGAAVRAHDCNPFARAAVRLNAEANKIAVTVSDSLDGIDLILAGDVFYDARAAADTLAFLDRTRLNALIGDPGRKDLPLDRLERLAQYSVPDFGSHEDVPATVYRFLR